jgi:hypothetical protein
VPRERLADTRGGAGDDDLYRCFLAWSMSWETVSSMPSPALTV